jgi:hypothetical protein
MISPSRTPSVSLFFHVVVSFTDTEIFDLQNNHLVGTIPVSIYNLSALNLFSVSNNTLLGGTISSLVGQLTNLARFEAGQTKLVGTIPDELYTLKFLTHIVLSNATMTGPMTQSIHQLNSTLLQLRLSDNDFTGALPTALDVLTALEYLYLEGNSFTGTISDAVCEQRGVGYQKLFRLFADCNIVCECNDLDCREEQ